MLEAEDGERALVIAREFMGTIDIVVSDVIMREVSGDALATTLQAKDASLRVLLVSGTADESVVSHLDSGTSSFLAKPFKPSELITKVHELLSSRPI